MQEIMESQPESVAIVVILTGTSYCILLKQISDLNPISFITDFYIQTKKLIC